MKSSFDLIDRKVLYHLFCLLIVIPLSCHESGNTEKSSNGVLTEILIEAEYFTDKDGITLMEDLPEEGTSVSLIGEGWLYYEVHISRTGWYNIDLKSIPEDTLDGIYWIEDLSDRNSETQLDLTGLMHCRRSDEFTPYTLLTRKRVLLTKGMHPLKFHFSGGKSSIDWFMLSFQEEIQNIRIN